MTETMTAPSAVVLDLKGLLCPMPIVRMAMAIKRIEIGQTLEATATDPGVMADVPAWARSAGHELVSLEKRDRGFHFVVRRSK
jgi:TusA-related sulfurtransferase